MCNDHGVPIYRANNEEWEIPLDRSLVHRAEGCQSIVDTVMLDYWMYIAAYTQAIDVNAK